MTTDLNDGLDHSGTGSGGLGQPSGPSMLEYLQFLLRHRRLLALSMGIPFVAVAVARSLTMATYTSSASFMPQQTDLSSGLAGLAAQFGVGVPGAADNQSPAFYADLLETREVLTAVLNATYVFPTDSGATTTTLLRELDIKAPTAGLVMERAIKRMTKIVNVDVRTRTGVIAFQVALPNPQLAQEVAQKLLDEVNRFNLEQRQTQAGAERVFNEQRLAELGTELRSAQDKLQAFLSKNRDYRSSPELTFEQDRLAQDIALRQTVYTSVDQAYEQARLNQVRDTPMITVIESPSLPAERDGRGRLKYGFLFAMLGGLFGIGLAAVREFGAGRRAAGDPEYAAFVGLLHQARRDLATGWEWVTGVFSRSKGAA